jgi:hypothetical protein
MSHILLLLPLCWLRIFRTCYSNIKIAYVNIKYSFLLKGTFGLKPATQFAERYHSSEICVLNMEDTVYNKFCNLACNLGISNVFY